MIEKLTIGTAQFGLNYGVANHSGQLTQNKVNSILQLAYDSGIRSLDTAHSYGVSEKVIGNYIKVNPNYNWKIITKINNSRKLESQINESIKNLSCRPQFILAHNVDLYLKKNFQLNIRQICQDNFISKIGVSTYTQKEILKVLNSNLIPDVIQLPMNILDTRLFHSGILKKIKDSNIKIHVRSVFLQGLFYLDDKRIKKFLPDAIPFLKDLSLIARENNLTLSEFSLLWILSLSEVDQILIGIDNSDQLKIHLETMKKEVDKCIFQKALNIHCENEKILNPTLW